MRPSYQKIKNCVTYRATIKDDSNKIIWTCSHHHYNRDNNYGRLRISAYTCACIAIKQLENNQEIIGMRGTQDIQD